MEHPTARKLQPGARLGRFELLERLGDGGMGEVYRARDVELGRDVAVKVLRAGGGGSGVSEERRRRFVREQQAAARIRHHGVVAVHDAGEVGGVSWLAMDLVEGESLEALLRRGPLEPAAVLRLGVACARAIEALHAAGVLHRDLKPANILVDREGNPRLTDFGVAALDGAESLTRTGQMIGTPLYMAPEQLAGQEADGRADVYGLGAVLFEALAGQPPWTAENFHELITAKTARPPAPSRVRRGAGRSSSAGSSSSGSRPGPVEVQADVVLLRALSPDPAERQPTAGALADELERALSGVSAGSPRRRVALLAGGTLAALLLLGALQLRGPAPGADSTREPESPAALRRRVEARLARAKHLLGSEPDLVAALRDSTHQPAEDPATRGALRAWAGLVALAEGDLARATELTDPAGPDAPGPARAPALALRGGLRAHAGDPVAALQDLDAATRSGVHHAELEGWRARALARRGVERADASRLLEQVAALRAAPGAGAAERAGAELLEVACLIGLGRRLEATDALDRLQAPPAELRWDLAVLAASDAASAMRYVEARDGAIRPGPGRLPRPARPLLVREGELATRLVGFIRQRTTGGGVLNDAKRVELAAALQLRTLLAPQRAEPADLALELMALIRKSVLAGFSGGMLELQLDISEAWPDDPKVVGEVVDDLLGLRFFDGAYLLPCPPAEATRLEAFGRRAVRLAPPASSTRVEAGVVHGAALLQLGRLDAAAEVLEGASSAIGTLQGADSQNLIGTLLVLRARLAASRGDTDRALALLDEAAGRVHEQVIAYVRLDALRTGGRAAQLLEETLAYAREGPYLANMAILWALQELLWSVLGGAGRWAEVSAYYELLLDAPRAPSHPEIARGVHALAQQGRLEEAAGRAQRLVGREAYPTDLPERVRAGDPATLADMQRLAH